MARHLFLSQTLEASPGMQSGDDLGVLHRPFKIQWENPWEMEHA